MRMGEVYRIGTPEFLCANKGECHRNHTCIMPESVCPSLVIKASGRWRDAETVVEG